MTGFPLRGGNSAKLNRKWSQAMPNLKFLILFISLLSYNSHAGWDANEKEDLLQEAKTAIKEFKRKDPSLKSFFNKAEGWVVFPTIGKAGFWIGGAYGEGVVYQKGRSIGYSDLKQLSFGLQFGGQAYSEIIFFRDKAALSRFKTQKLEFDAQASAVAADKGAATNIDYHNGVAVFTLIKGGLMAEASVGGQSFSYTPK